MAGLMRFSVIGPPIMGLEGGHFTVQEHRPTFISYVCTVYDTIICTHIPSPTGSVVHVKGNRICDHSQKQLAILALSTC